MASNTRNAHPSPWPQTNAPFSEWGATFTDPRLAAAIVDRLTFNAHILETGHDSYRLRHTRAKTKGTTTNKTT